MIDSNSLQFFEWSYYYKTNRGGEGTMLALFVPLLMDVKNSKFVHLFPCSSSGLDLWKVLITMLMFYQYDGKIKVG
jgi:hypothetical protein